jgi:ABC-type branched-subunit amino acid transport system ATPase component
VLLRNATAASASTATAPAGRRQDDHRETPALALRDVAVSFGGVQALRDVSLDVGRREIVGIIGPNGAGKSTLLDVVSGFVRPDRGRVGLAGRRIDQLRPDARAALGLARSFQSVRLFPALTVRENLAVAQDRRAARNAVLAAGWARSVRAAERAVEERSAWLLAMFGLEDVADAFADELSAGVRRALDLACVTAADPKVVLFDEPSSGVARAETEELAGMLVRAARDGGWAMVIVEHDLALVASLADRVVTMDLGLVGPSGTPAEIMGDAFGDGDR